MAGFLESLWQSTVPGAAIANAGQKIDQKNALQQYFNQMAGSVGTPDQNGIVWDDTLTPQQKYQYDVYNLASKDSDLAQLALKNADPNTATENLYKMAQIKKLNSEADQNTLSITPFSNSPLSQMAQPSQQMPVSPVPSPQDNGTITTSNSPMAPMSVRNNNPGNLKNPVTGNFQQFSSPQEGIDANLKDLTLKLSGQSPVMQSKFGQGYTPSVANIISTWAPSSDNNDTVAYIKKVSSDLGVDPNAPLNPQQAPALLHSMTGMEGGQKSSQYFNAPQANTQTFAEQSPYPQSAADTSASQSSLPPGPQRQPVGFIHKGAGLYTEGAERGYANVGYVNNDGHVVVTGVAPIPGGSKDAVNGSIITSENSALTGQAFIDTLQNPDVKNKTQALLDGRAPYPTINSRTPSAIKQALEAAQQADPTYNASTAKVRMQTAESYAPNGTNGKVLQSISTASGHIADLKEAYDALHNGSFTTANAVGNYIAGKTSSYDPKVTAAIGKFNTALNAVAPELAKISAGTGGQVGEGEINKRRDAFSPNMSPTEFNSAITEAASLVKSRADSLNEQYQQTMGGNPPPTAPKYSDRVLNHFRDLGVDLGPSSETGDKSSSTSGWSAQVIK
jgi:hypothetical protein